MKGKIHWVILNMFSSDIIVMFKIRVYLFTIKKKKNLLNIKQN